MGEGENNMWPVADQLSGSVGSASFVWVKTFLILLVTDLRVGKLISPLLYVLSFSYFV